MTPEEIERERKAFEQWARVSMFLSRMDYPALGRSYVAGDTECSWRAWLARAQSEKAAG